MKKLRYSLILLGLFSVLVLYCPFVFAGHPESSLPPVKVVVVSGSNYDMGVQYGEMAADQIAINLETTWDLLLAKLDSDTIENDIKVWTYYLEKYNPRLKEWLDGISAGCAKKGITVSYVDLVALMVFPQELWARPAGEYPEETGVTATAGVPLKSKMNLVKRRTDARAMAACTAFAATGDATTDGNPMVSLTLGFFQEITQYVILFAYPDEGQPFVSLTMAGKVVNNTGMNENFGWVMTAAVTHPFTCASSWGVTSEVYHHYLQQYCQTPAQAMAYLDSTPSGGVTGIFLFADKSGDAFAYEVGSCASDLRSPGDLDESGFVTSANNYNSPSMQPYAIPAEWFPDTYIRYATIYRQIEDGALSGNLGFEFTKKLWQKNNWYDEMTQQWNTVPVPNDPDDWNTCNVPGNNCEGGESQTIAFPVQQTVYLQSGGPHGTSIQHFWPPEDAVTPKPTGEYTKWKLGKSIDKTAQTASRDTLVMLKTASRLMKRQMSSLSANERQELKDLLKTAWKAWKNAEQNLSAGKGKGHHKGWKRTPWGNVHNRMDRQMPFHPHAGWESFDMALWSAAYTDYATAQLYSQMVTSKLKKLLED